LVVPLKRDEIVSLYSDCTASGAQSPERRFPVPLIWEELGIGDVFGLCIMDNDEVIWDFALEI
jgi:hypothetical protein